MSSEFYDIEYRFTSSLNDDSAASYISSYKGNILQVDIDTDEAIIIGKVKLDLIQVSRAYDNSFPVIEIFDNDDQIINMAEHIFDFDQDDFKEEIKDFFDGAFIHTDICLLRRVEIIESHRGKGIGTKVIKDIFDRFSSSCGIMVVEAYPLQFKQEPVNISDPKEVEWAKKLNFGSLNKDFEKSFYKLKAFYKKSGFNHVEGFDEWMFINPAIINNKLNDRPPLEDEIRNN